MSAVFSKKEVSLGELVSLLESENKVDYAVPGREMEANMTEEGFELRFPETVSSFVPRVMPFTEHAASQFHSRLGNGFKTFAETMHEKGMVDEYRSCVLGLTEDDSRTLRVRTVQSQQYQAQTVRAVVSDRFKPIDDDVIFGAAIPIIDSQRFVALGGNKTDTRTVCKFIERDPSIAIQSGSRTREFHLGFILGNSEVGTASASFSMFMSDRWCSNGCIFSKEVLASISYRHIGSRIDVRHGVIQGNHAERAEMASIKNLVTEATKQAMSIEGRERIKASLEASANRMVEGDVSEFFERLGKKANLTKNEVKELPLYMQQDRLSQLEVQAAITALAQDKPYERRIELETIGGNVLMMGDRHWESLALEAVA